MDQLDQIAAEAAVLETDQAAAMPGAEPEAPPGIPPGVAWAQLPMMFGGILSMAFPELRAVYTEPACMKWGEAMAAVGDKYGWDAAETMAKWGPEIALTLATVPLAIPTVAVIKKAADAKKKRADLEGKDLVKEAPAAPDATDGAHVSQ